VLSVLLLELLDVLLELLEHATKPKAIEAQAMPESNLREFISFLLNCA
jgi:PIN domain nuclease of toxin-antitoxin system